MSFAVVGLVQESWELVALCYSSKDILLLIWGLYGFIMHFFMTNWCKSEQKINYILNMAPFSTLNNYSYPFQIRTGLGVKPFYKAVRNIYIVVCMTCIGNDYALETHQPIYDIY